MKTLLVLATLLSSIHASAATRLNFSNGLHTYYKGMINGAVMRNVSDDPNAAVIMLTVVNSGSDYNQCSIGGQTTANALEILRQIQQGQISEFHCIVRDGVDPQSAKQVGGNKFFVKMAL